jgi:hypothetical protein
MLEMKEPLDFSSGSFSSGAATTELPINYDAQMKMMTAGWSANFSKLFPNESLCSCS